MNAHELSLAVRSIVCTHRFVFNRETDLQQQVAELLARHKLEFVREFPLSNNERPDFFAPPYGLVIEVKVDGSEYAIARQLTRYAAHERVTALLLITSRPIVLPPQILGKPVAMISTWRGAL